MATKYLNPTRPTFLLAAVSEHAGFQWTFGDAQRQAKQEVERAWRENHTLWTCEEAGFYYSDGCRQVSLFAGLRVSFGLTHDIDSDWNHVQSMQTPLVTDPWQCMVMQPSRPDKRHCRKCCHQ